MTLADEAELEHELDRLYGLPFDEFVPARNESARRARREGQRAIAARIGELAKPTFPAWVVNQLARRRELDVQRLVKAGEGLAGAQMEALRGGGSEQFLQARREEQRALESLAAAAREILIEAGRPIASNSDRVVATLRAAAVTDGGRTRLKQGRLTEELELSGFEALAGVELPPRSRRRAPLPAKPKAAPPAKPPPAQPRRDDTKEKRGQVGKARERVRDLRAGLRDRESRLRQAERRAAELRRGLDAAEQEAQTLERERKRAETELTAAERTLAELTGKPAARS